MSNSKLSSITIEVLDHSGYWLKVGSTMNSQQMITSALNSAHRAHGKKARAVDDKGNIVDIKQ